MKISSPSTFWDFALRVCVCSLHGVMQNTIIMHDYNQNIGERTPKKEQRAKAREREQVHAQASVVVAAVAVQNGYAHTHTHT
jgi:cobyric acid synthase